MHTATTKRRLQLPAVPTGRASDVAMTSVSTSVNNNEIPPGKLVRYTTCGLRRLAVNLPDLKVFEREHLRLQQLLTIMKCTTWSQVKMA